MIRLIGFMFLCGNIFLSAQNIPGWLYKPKGILCDEFAVGYAEKSFYHTSAINSAIKNAVIQLIKQNKVIVVSKKLFWTTALGNSVIADNFVERFDTSQIESLLKKVVLLDTFMTSNFVAVLISRNTCENFDKNKFINNNTFKKPDWITNIPFDEDYFYAVGASPEYFYKTSSVYEAERSALYSLAASKQLSVSSLQKSSDNIEEQREEIVSVEIYNSEILERWFDSAAKIFYVLMRMPKQ
ncbi:MAG: hypothetical protein CO129_10395 [Ignavibacteriales bacterium CG_4_9_14_3_um_filter_34_10]|nr:MAG: hypothetical protein CO129_10395 [Ignavibacteriales bacterium CG_4_9_14_3_um_filter_34_10]